MLFELFQCTLTTFVLFERHTFSGQTCQESHNAKKLGMAECKLKGILLKWNNPFFRTVKAVSGWVQGLIMCK